jgi:hypothetical protein
MNQGGLVQSLVLPLQSVVGEEKFRDSACPNTYSPQTKAAKIAIQLAYSLKQKGWDIGHHPI